MVGRKPIIVFVVIALCITTSCNAGCTPSSCGSIRNISYPFRLKDEPKHCGNPLYNLSCEYNRTVLYLYSGKYYVQYINYSDFTIRVVDSWIDDGNDQMVNNCPFIPRYPLTPHNFSGKLPYYPTRGTESVIFTTCENPVNSSLFVDITSSYTSSKGYYSYVWVDSFFRMSELNVSCHIDTMTLTSWPELRDKVDRGEKASISCVDVHKMLRYGFDLSYKIDAGANLSIWRIILNDILYYIESFIIYGIPSIVLYIIGRFILGTPFVIAFLIYKWRRRHLSLYDNIEKYLQSHNNLTPIRYSYSHIKKMTQSFKEKLGEGGFGCVYKGKLRSHNLVAVKMLNKSKANGQDFINEVATIGRIHHVNVVQLIGFCAEGSKRALVYDFMPNGSLDKYIFSPEKMSNDSNPLNYKKMFEISLGVARGIEYLHRGCDKRILHFDIKPHNILLDENFTPKVSDFGLAGLYPADDSIVNLTAARGTFGYMAPELCYKNIGGVSYKADIYSFGMLLMEMAGRRKNLNAFTEHSSRIYFPSWAYDQFNEGKEIEIEDATEEEMELTKKMVLVALWCIQMKPSDRPAMNKVVEMLEGEVESIEMPPKPFQNPREITVEDCRDNAMASCLSVRSDESSESISLILNVD